jgi:CubicO group peptidase (beta-lactamase class C family)
LRKRLKGWISVVFSANDLTLRVKVPNADKITVHELEAYNAPELDKLNVNANTKISPRELIEFAVKQQPLFALETKWYYCNTNYLLLGLIIESVTHHTVEEEIRNRLLVSLGLDNTSFPTTDPNMPLRFARGYTLGKKRRMGGPNSLAPTRADLGVMISDMTDMKVGSRTTSWETRTVQPRRSSGWIACRRENRDWPSASASPVLPAGTDTRAEFPAITPPLTISPPRT